MFYKKYQIKPITNKFFYLPPNIVFHKDIIENLYKLGHDNEIPNLLFYGNNGCGKHSLVNLLLYYLFGDEIFDIKIVSYSINTNNNTTKQFNIKQSKHHIVFFPYNNNFDKNIIQNVLKNYIINSSFKNSKFKVIIINNFDELNISAQQSLRRTMEDYSIQCRFIFIGKSTNNIIDPLKSRFVAYRITNPTTEDLIKCGMNVLINEQIPFTYSDLEKLAIAANNNVMKMMLSLDLYKINGNNNESYDEKIISICNMIVWKKIFYVDTIKEHVYNLMIANIPPSKIMFDIVIQLIKHIKDVNLVSDIVNIGIKHNNLLSNSRRDIFVFDSFILNLMNFI